MGKEGEEKQGSGSSSSNIASAQNGTLAQSALRAATYYVLLSYYILCIIMILYIMYYYIIICYAKICVAWIWTGCIQGDHNGCSRFEAAHKKRKAKMQEYKHTKARKDKGTKMEKIRKLQIHKHPNTGCIRGDHNRCGRVGAALILRLHHCNVHLATLYKTKILKCETLNGKALLG